MTYCCWKELFSPEEFCLLANSSINHNIKLINFSDKHALDVLLTRLYDFGFESSPGEYKFRCGLTVSEFDVLHQSCFDVFPEKSRTVISRLQNRCESVEDVFRLNVYIPSAYPKMFQETGVPVLQTLAEYSRTGTQFQYDEGTMTEKQQICVYLSQSDVDDLKEIEDLG